VHAPLGTFNASGLIGPIRLQTHNRDVQMSGITNSVEIQLLDRGDIELRPENLPLARIKAQTRFGNITLGLPKDAKFDLTASTARGEVTNEYGAPLATEDYRRGGSVKGSNGGPVVDLRTELGAIIVRQAVAGEPPLEQRRFGSRAPQPQLPKQLKGYRELPPVDQ
jgi:hypothetical protein